MRHINFARKVPLKVAAPHVSKHEKACGLSHEFTLKQLLCGAPAAIR